MTTVHHAMPHGKFTKIQRNLRRHKVHRTNHAPIFLDPVLEIEIMQEPQSNLEENPTPESYNMFPQEQTHTFSH